MSFEKQVEGGVAVTREIDGRHVKFGMLTMRDFATMRSYMPDKEREGSVFGDVWSWASSPLGIIWTVTLAAQKFDPIFTETQAETLLPPIPLYRLAREILDVSAGDAVKTESGAEGNATTPTGPSAPAS